MVAERHKYSPGKTGTIVDMLHMGICVVVVIVAVMAFANPEKHRFLFPIIFLLAAILSFVTGWYSWINSKRNLKRRRGSIVYFVVGILLSALFLISAISIWFHN